MPLVVRVDDEVYEAIWKRGAELGLPFPSPNDVLRADYLDNGRAENALGPQTATVPLPREISRRTEDWDAQFPSSDDLEVKKLLDALRPSLLALSSDGLKLSKTRDVDSITNQLCRHQGTGQTQEGSKNYRVR